MTKGLFLLLNKRFLTTSAFLIFAFSLFFNSTTLLAITQEEQEAIWRAELAQTEQDIAKWQSILNSTKANTASLQQEAAVLNAKIKQAQALIKKRNIAIEQLGKDINKKVTKIGELENKIEKGHESLAQLIRKTNEIDEFSLPEVMLGNKDISEFFADIDSFQTIKESLQDLFVEIRENKKATENEKLALDKKKAQEIDTKAAVEAEKKEVEKNEKEKQYLIQVNKTQEKTYAQVLAERQAKAGEIRAKLFKLAGGSAAIPFGTALTYAQGASAKTGVSPAFVLAILTQESSLGANVGKCYLTDVTTGAGVNITSGKVWTNLMKASRDVKPFLEITGKLGYDPLKTVVSCPIAGVAGYGGAMGPAQFIASTWNIFVDRLKDTLGHDANPWVAEDAFMASAMYLGDLGAGSGTYSGEIKAACKYYGSGGTTCSYGRSVMKLKEGIQADIDYMLQYGVSRR
ncbi:MAG: Peptidase, family [Patescibacteria group bacterium]|nr:Peptidase, family [Patescibacteria group bacterium]